MNRQRPQDVFSSNEGDDQALLDAAPDLSEAFSIRMMHDIQKANVQSSDIGLVQIDQALTFLNK